MKRPTRYLVSLVLALIMTVSVFPASAFAASGVFGLFGDSTKPAQSSSTGSAIQKNSDGTYTVLNNGKKSTSTGFVTTTINGVTGSYYADKGIINPNLNGVRQGTVNGENAYWYLKNGKIADDYNGNVKTSKHTRTVKNGKVTAILINVPMENQMPKYPTGCEAASATSVLNFYGTGTSVDEMVSIIPRENIQIENDKPYGPSIYEKFVGDPTSTYTAGNPGYGGFAPVITKAMNQALKKHNSGYKAYDITGTKPADLYKKVRAGQPVIVWATYNMKTPQTVNAWYVKDASKPDGEYYFEYPRGTHVLVLDGIDDENDTITIMDPYGAVNKTFDRQLFESKYALLGQMAIEVR